METRKTKKEIVQMLLKKQFEENNEEELINMLIDEPIAVDVDKLSDANRSFGDKVADKITEVAGSWYFIIGMIFAKNIDGFILSNYLSKFKFLLFSVFGYFGSFLFPVSREYIVKYHYCNDMHKCMKNYKGLK